MAVSFGAERQAAFEHAKTKTTISMWQPNGTIYTFGRDVNVMWRHGIPGNGSIGHFFDSRCMLPAITVCHF